MDKDRSIFVRGTQPLPMLYAHVGYARRRGMSFGEEDRRLVKLINGAWAEDNPSTYRLARWLENHTGAWLVRVKIENACNKGFEFDSLDMEIVYPREFVYFFRSGTGAPSEAVVSEDTIKRMLAARCDVGAWPFVKKYVLESAKNTEEMPDAVVKALDFKHAGRPVATLKELEALVADVEDQLSKTGKIPEWLLPENVKARELKAYHDGPILEVRPCVTHP